jgi:hypothetical protein
MCGRDMGELGLLHFNVERVVREIRYCADEPECKKLAMMLVPKGAVITAVT